MLFLINCSYKLGLIMTRYDFLKARFVCGQKANYKWRSYHANRPLVPFLDELSPARYLNIKAEPSDRGLGYEYYHFSYLFGRPFIEGTFLYTYSIVTLKALNKLFENNFHSLLFLSTPFNIGKYRNEVCVIVN